MAYPEEGGQAFPIQTVTTMLQCICNIPSLPAYGAGRGEKIEGELRETFMSFERAAAGGALFAQFFSQSVQLAEFLRA